MENGEIIFIIYLAGKLFDGNGSIFTNRANRKNKATK